MQHNQYQWTGLNALGAVVKGTIQAQSSAIARFLLHQQNISITKIKRQHTWFKQKCLKHQDINTLCRQLASLLQAHIPLTQALDTLIKSQDHLTRQLLLNHLKQDIQAGLSLSQACQKHPYFNALLCHIIEAGEQSGTLAILLIKWVRYQEQLSSIRKKITAAIRYPLIVLALTLCISTGILCFIVPQFESIFHDFGAPLPAFTQFIIQLSMYTRTYGLWMIATCVFITIGLLSFKHTHASAYQAKREQLVLSLPWFGQTWRHAILARISYTLSILLSAGMPLVTALEKTAQIAGHSLYYHTLITLGQQVTQGLSLHASMEQSGQFPASIIQMITIGEESGQLEPMLTYISTQHHDALTESTQLLEQMLEPLLLISLGLIIGLLMISLYLPIFQLGAIV